MAKSLSQYRKEADVKPFVLEVDDSTSITIQPPDGDAFLSLGEVQMNDAHGMLSLLCGDQYEEVMDVLGKEPGPVLLAVVQDMARKFGLIEPGVAPGGRKALPR